MKLRQVVTVFVCLIGQCSTLAAPKSGQPNRPHIPNDAILSMHPSVSAESIVSEGLLLQAKGQTGKAMSCYKVATYRFPNDFMGHLFLAELLYDQNHLQEAIKETKRVLWLKPDYTLEHLRLGNMLNQTGNKAEAVKEWKTVLLLNDDKDSSDEAKKMLKLFSPG